MRVPSRRMPKILPKKTGWVGWLIVGALICLFGWLLLTGFRQNPIATGVGATAVLVFSYLMGKHGRNRAVKLQALIVERPSESICDFARSFDAREIDTWVIRAVYEQLQQYLAPIAQNFPVHADDRLLGLLVDDPDDLDLDILHEISQRTGRTLDNTKRNPYFDRVRTVRELVLFFNAQASKAQHNRVAL